MKILVSTIKFSVYPLTSRIAKGEGGLVLFNILHAYSVYSLSTLFWIDSLISVLAMCALYNLNDFRDRHIDVINPKKNKNFINEILQQEKLYIYTNIIVSITAIALSLMFFSVEKATLMTLLIIVNWLYSYKFKSMPGIDILSVILWGGLFASIAGSFQLHLFIIVGIMTGIAHIYQIITDREADEKANIRTSIVVFPQLHKYVILFYCLILGTYIYMYIGLIWSISCLIPLAIYLLSKNISLSWYVSRFYFLICFIKLLYLQYGNL